MAVVGVYKRANICLSIEFVNWLLCVSTYIAIYTSLNKFGVSYMAMVRVYLRIDICLST